MDAKLLMMAAAGVGEFEMYPYDAVNSARFGGTTADYLNFTPGGGNRRLWTFSTWLKRCDTSNHDLLIAGANSSNKTEISIGTDNSINFELVSGGSNVGRRETTAVLRDPSSWYHIVCVLDSANSTAEDRQQIYINGVRITVFDTNTTTTLNTDSFFDNSQVMHIGRRTYNTTFNLNGYLSQTCFIDGAALTASSFGEDKNGVWVPSDPTGLTFGDEGWLLAYASSGALGDDTSGNGNDWTVNGLAAADQMTDTPSGNNFPTWNPLKFRTPSLVAVLSEGNLAALFDNGSYGEYSFGTMSIPAEGKWYFECKCTAVGGESNHGIVGANVPEGNPDEARTYRNNGQKFTNFASGASYGDTYTTNDIIGVAVDMDGGNLYFYKNNTIQASGTAAFTDLLTAYPDGGWLPVGNGYNNASVLANFGQTAFAYTPPTGYVALNTANLPEPTIGPNSTTKPYQAFDAAIYTGNGTAIGSGGKTISSLAFQPNLTWIKNRDATDSHMLFDSVRGVTKHISSDSTAAQVTTAESLTSFTSTGFTLGNNVAVNTNTEDYVAWNWIEGATPGFDVVSFTGNATARTIAHNLGVVPQLILVKNLADTDNWAVYHASNTAAPATDYLILNTTAATADDATIWNDTAPTSSVFSVGTSALTNGNTEAMIAYVFAAVDGFSKFGSWLGESAAEFIYTGFRPAFVLTKRSSNTSGWYIFDDARGFNGAIDWLGPNVTTADTSVTSFDILSNGFRDNGFAGDDGETILYAAFAETPFKYSNAR